MDNLVLEARKREETGKKVNKLRKSGLIPAVVYGRETEPQNLAVDFFSFQKIYEAAGRSSLIDLKIENKPPLKVIIQDIQTDPLTDKFINIDFHAVKMTEKITAEIELKFVGESKAVKEDGGVLVKNIDKIKVEAYPQDLVHEIEVDISNLKTFDDIIHISELKIPEKIKILNDGKETVALVTPPRSEAELEALEETVEEKVEEVEKVGEKEKAEAEEAEEAAPEKKEKVEAPADKKEEKGQKKE